MILQGRMESTEVRWMEDTGMGLAGGASDDWYISQPGVTFSATIELPEKDRHGGSHEFSLPPSEIVRVRSSLHPRRGATYGPPSSPW